jgi:SAM-dependent methyltransferase
MLTRARSRFSEGDPVEFHEADLTGGLAEFDTAEFDLVLCQLVLEHIEDWETVFRAFTRVVAPDGRVVISTSHPVRDYVDAEFPVRDQVLAESATYSDIERVDRNWGDETDAFLMPFYRRPLEAMLRPATDAGLVVEELRDPDVTDAFREARPDLAAQFTDGPPNFVCIRYRKPSSATPGSTNP